MKTKHIAMMSAVAICLAIGSLAVGDQPKAYLHSYNVPASGVAIDGNCPVSYHTDGKAVRGKQELAVKHDDLWYFCASTEDKRAFESDPQKYLPAYGGWCAFGMSIQDKFPVDPTNFKIVDGRLMLFLKNKNVDALALWNKGTESDLRAQAEAHWKKVSQ